MTGCSDGGSGEYTGPSLSGSDWSGGYAVTEGPGFSRSITATVEQDGSSVIITTSRPAGTPAHRFTGSISSDGNMVMTDQYDGETWTTLRGPASPSLIKILDYRKDISETALAVVDIRR